ncbi:MAG: hypothetical protein ABEJ73_11395 [Haloplanus sp.]
MPAQQSYEVYLTDEASADFGDGPLHADGIDFYDSGVWITHADGRDFFPYGRVIRIRERVAAQGGAGDTATGERRDAASGTTDTVDDTELDVE